MVDPQNSLTHSPLREADAPFRCKRSTIRCECNFSCRTERGGGEEGPGPLPTSAGLPRMRVEHADRGRLETTELDAYHALGLLIRYEEDLHAPWTNRLGQKISAADLLDYSWDYYLIARNAEAEFADHSHLHLVEILLAYNARLDRGSRRDPNQLKQRFLLIELERRE